MMRRWGWSVLGAMLLTLGGGRVQAAETLLLSYGPLEFAVTVADLEAYIQTGQVPSRFQPLVAQLPAAELARFTATLQQPIAVAPEAVERVFGTSTGRVLLNRLGLVVQTERGENGADALKTAMLRAAQQPGGVTFLRILREFPGTTIRLNLVRGLAVITEVNRYITQVNHALAVLNQEFLQQARRQSLPPNLPDLTQRGPVTWQVKDLTLTDTRRQRPLPVTLYLPAQPNPPTVVISHGLGDSRQSFAYLAEHLASYGLAVVLPEHPGSDARRLQQVLDGQANEYIIPQELVDRPQDIRFVLDALADQPINRERVLVVGHSYGGYTALAVGGARLNLAHLSQVCAQVEQGVALNLSLLLQCPGRRLSNPPVQFRDERVVGVVAINPVGSALFGPTGLAQVKVPTLIVAATQDVAAPALDEQILPLTWLGSPQRYLALIEGASHFSVLGQNTTGIPLPIDVVGPAPEVAQLYIKVLTLAFAQVHLAQRSEFAPFLTAAYARRLTRNPLPLQLVSNPPVTPLRQALAR
ncbi:MAG: alpha/beta hydrolase [Gloeomargarita sp. SKYG116]|nr:alpha/beta hydrolase [Gloeomargarita sp. SKYG116]MDW8401193.1 alpha/beta hydrolase [Gloeomargarita sp. SKYGB_i_bin116]